MTQHTQLNRSLNIERVVANEVIVVHFLPAMKHYISRHLPRDNYQARRRNSDGGHRLDCADVVELFSQHQEALRPKCAMQVDDTTASDLIDVLSDISRLRNRFAHDDIISDEIRLDDLLSQVVRALHAIGDTDSAANARAIYDAYAQSVAANDPSPLDRLYEMISIPAAFINGAVLEFYLPHMRHDVSHRLRSKHGSQWLDAVLPHIRDPREQQRMTCQRSSDGSDEQLLDAGGIVAAFDDENATCFNDLEFRSLRGRALNIAKARNTLWHSLSSSDSSSPEKLRDQADGLVKNVTWMLEHFGHPDIAKNLSSLWVAFDPKPREERRKLAESWSTQDDSWRSRKLGIRKRIAWATFLASVIAVVCAGSAHHVELIDQRWLVTGSWMLFGVAFAMWGPLWKFRVFAPIIPVVGLYFLPDSGWRVDEAPWLTVFLPDSVHAVLYFALWMSLLRLSVATVFNRENGTRIRGAQQHSWEDPEAMIALHRVRTMWPVLDTLLERHDPNLRTVSKFLSFVPICLATGSASVGAIACHLSGLRPAGHEEAWWLLTVAAITFSISGMFTLWFARAVIHKREAEQFLASAAPFLVFLAISYFVLTEVFFTPPEVWVGDWRQWHHWH